MVPGHFPRRALEVKGGGRGAAGAGRGRPAPPLLLVEATNQRYIPRNP